MNTTRHQRQRGATLIEGLVALLVLSLSLVATVRLQGWLRQHSDLARERSEAVLQAQAALEARRGFHDLAAFDRGTPSESDGRLSATAFHLQHERSLDEGLETAHVTVRWQPRSGEEQQLELASGVARLAPVYSALLEVPPQDRVLAARRALPTAARVLPDGRRVIQPVAGSRVAWVVNGVTGEIEQQCRVAAASHPRGLEADDLTDCEPFNARLVRGFIRFALSATPDPLHANDAPLQLGVQAAGERCETETVAGDGERYVAYACAMPVGQPRDVEPSLVPQGWSFGLDAGTFKACRYPGVAPRNYLIVRGDLACPSADPPHNGAPVVTVQHQP